jgi:Tfp pilus assembly protein PilF
MMNKCATHPQVCFLTTALCLALTCAGCSNTTAEIEMIEGVIGSADADIQIYEVTASSNEDCRRGVKYLDMEHWSEAAEAFRRALDADREDHRALYGLGIAREQEGEVCEAAGHYERAVMLSTKKRQDYLDAEKRARDKCEN